MSLLAALLALAGLTFIALGMERHQGELLKRRLLSRERRRAKVMGWATIAAAYASAAAAWGIAVGSVLWIGLVSLAAMTVLLTLSWRNNR